MKILLLIGVMAVIFILGYSIGGTEPTQEDWFKHGDEVDE